MLLPSIAPESHQTGANCGFKWWLDSLAAIMCVCMLQTGRNYLCNRSTYCRSPRMLFTDWLPLFSCSTLPLIVKLSPSVLFWRHFAAALAFSWLNLVSCKWSGCYLSIQYKAKAMTVKWTLSSNSSRYSRHFPKCLFLQTSFE